MSRGLDLGCVVLLKVRIFFFFRKVEGCYAALMRPYQGRNASAAANEWVAMGASSDVG